jgi:hypothetical protein
MLYPTNKQEAFKFITFLEEGLPYIDAWTPTDINSGGCGVFVLLLTDKLDELKIPYEIIGIPIPEKEKREMKTNIRNKTLLDTMPFQHFLVKIDSLYFDCKGIENPMVLALGNKPVTKEQLKSWVNSKDKLWNETYDITCNEGIKEKINEIFSKYESFVPGTFKFPKKGDVVYTKHTVRYKERDAQMNFLARMLG